MDRNHAEPHPGSQQALKQLMSSHGLVDVWRRMHTGSRQFTWSHFTDGKISMARLDRIYCFKHHFSIFKDCRILPVGFTDHSLVLCRVFIRNMLPRSAYWHFNSVLTFDQSFREALCYLWNDVRQKKRDFISLQQWWEHGKGTIRQLCQQHTFNVTREMANSIRELETDIIHLEMMSESTGNLEYIETMKNKKVTLAHLLDTKVQGVLVRSRMQNITEMDAPSSFFFGLERKHGQEKLIHSLLSDTGQELTEPGHIRQRAVDFYSELYRSEYTKNEELLDGFCAGLPQISEETNSQLNGALTLQELTVALQSMQGQKAPGIDGLTVEFYKAFWDVIGHDVLEVFNASLHEGLLPTSCLKREHYKILKTGVLCLFCVRTIRFCLKP